MTFKVNTIPPKRLAATIDGTATTFQLSDILGFDGVALTQSIVGDTLYGSFQDTTGTYLELFKVDTSTIANTNITMSKRGLQFNEDGTEAEVAGNKRLWIKNQTIVNLGTNVPALFRDFMDKVSAETVAGVKTFSSSPIVPTPTTNFQAATKKYVDDVDAATDAAIATKVSLTGNETVAGIKTFSSSPVVPTGGTGTQAANHTDIANAITGASGTATNSVAGTTKLSVAAVSAPNPIAVGDNDPRVPTQDENDALAGTGTPSSSNKYITEDTFGAINNYGDGSDGDVTISSPTTLTRDMYYNNLTVNSTLTTAGYKIFVADTITGTGTIDWGTANNGSAGSPGNSGSAGGGGSGGASSGNGQFVSTAGSDGGAGSPGTNGTAGTAGVARTSSIGGNGSNGGGGQGTSGGTGGGGGTGGTATVQTKVGVFANLSIFGIDFKKDGTFIPYQAAGGSGGGGGGANNFSGANAGGGGGAGASGGIVFIMAKTWAGTFVIKSVGGNGGAGGAAYAGGAAGGGGGGGGRGGSSIVIYKTKTWTGSYNLAGGAAGAGGATSGAAGVAGGTGTSYEIASLTR